MANLSDYTIREDGLLVPTYTNSVLLAANVPEFFDVPQSHDGQYAKHVLFGKGAAADFYARAFTAEEGADRVTYGTFTEYATNGGFDSDTGWTKGAGWTIGTGVATATGDISTAISQSVSVTPGRTYTVIFTAAPSAGSVTVSLGGTSGTARSTSDTFTENIVAGSSGVLAFTGAGYSGTIDNVLVYEAAWTLGTGWTIAGSTAVATGDISTALSQTAASPLIQGQAYLLTFTATQSAGGVIPSIGGTNGTERTSSATFSEVIIAGATQTIAFTGNSFTGTIDNVTIYPCASVPGDATAGQSAIQNPKGFLLNGNKTRLSVVSAGTPIITASFYK